VRNSTSCREVSGLLLLRPVDNHLRFYGQRPMISWRAAETSRLDRDAYTAAIEATVRMLEAVAERGQP
jgi:hypothetical protein